VEVFCLNRLLNFPETDFVVAGKSWQ